MLDDKAYELKSKHAEMQMFTRCSDLMSDRPKPVEFGTDFPPERERLVHSHLHCK